MSFAEVVTCPICGGVEGVGMLGPMLDQLSTGGAA